MPGPLSSVWRDYQDLLWRMRVFTFRLYPGVLLSLLPPLLRLRRILLPVLYPAILQILEHAPELQLTHLSWEVNTLCVLPAAQLVSIPFFIPSLICLFNSDPTLLSSPVPIYEGRASKKQPFRFSRDDFRDLADRAKTDNREIDTAIDNLVVVGYTVNTFGSLEFPPNLSLNLHFVIRLF